MDKREGAPAPEVVFDWTPEEARDWPLRAYHAAGGVVVREGRVLLVRSLYEGTMEVKLPKGRWEAGETLEECAVREVREESGLEHPVIVSLLGTGESRFATQGHRYERVETYFLMTSAESSGSAAEGDWERTVEWCPLDEAEAKITYPLEKAAVRWAIAALRHREP